MESYQKVDMSIGKLKIYFVLCRSWINMRENNVNTFFQNVVTFNRFQHGGTTTVYFDSLLILILFFLNIMELFRTQQYYIFVKGEYSLWWDRVTGELLPKTGKRRCYCLYLVKNHLQ